MAFTFPFTRAGFMDLLPVQDVRFFLGQQHQMAGTGGGEILKSEVAPPLWRGSVDLAPMKARAAAGVEALLSALEAPAASFLVYKANQIGPAADPLGAALSGYSPTIKDVNVNGSQVKLQGLPATYAISAGDMLSFTYNTDRTALHRIAYDRTAVGGSMGWLELGPVARPTWPAVGTAVELIKPYCKAVLVPGSVNFGTTRNGITTGMAFQFQQTLR